MDPVLDLSHLEKFPNWRLRKAIKDIFCGTKKINISINILNSSKIITANMISENGQKQDKTTKLQTCSSS